MYKVISFGHRCATGTFMQGLKVKTESYPFDWLISKLHVIKDCIETNFVHFLNVNNYVIQHTETYNMIDDKKYHLCNEIIQVNTYYETNKDNTQTYNFKLALNHRYIHEHYDYYQRCINRLYDLFKSDIKKYYIYFHPICGINDYQTNKNAIMAEFDDFNNYIINKTINTFGIYFILIKHTTDTKSIKIIDTPTYCVFILYCNENFLDGAAPFMGDCDNECQEVMTILQNILI